MKQNNFGRIIMTASAAGLYGNFGQTNYSAAKLGVTGMMNTLKIEGDKYNIKVNTIAPIAASRLTREIMPPDIFDKSKPEFVAPMVLYLVSDKCSETGQIFNAGLGCYNRAAILTNRGKKFGDNENMPTVEMIHEHFDEINNMDNVREISDATSAVMSLIDPPPEPEQSPGQSPEQSLGQSEGQSQKSGRRSDPTTIFKNMASKFKPDAAKGVDVVFQFNVNGKKGGKWTIIVKNNKCDIQPGTIEKASCTLTISDENFVKLFTGEMTSMQAFLSGKLSIDGDIMKSQLIEKLFDRLLFNS